MSGVLDTILDTFTRTTVSLCGTRLDGKGNKSAVAKEYLEAFAPHRHSDPFLTYYKVGSDKNLQSTSYTRGEFYDLALRACHVLATNGLRPGDCVTHFFSCNTLGDLAFRLAAVFVGVTPVTINWQADTPDRVLYKVALTQSKLVLIDDDTDASVVELLKGKADPAPLIFNTSGLPDAPALSLSSLSAAMALAVDATGPDATRFVIFTSGTTGNPKGVKLAYKAYKCNRDTFESFLEAGDDKQLVAVVVNPMHHTNSTSMTDWALRKPGAQVHLLQRYTTQYWSVLARAGTRLSSNTTASGAKLQAAIDERKSAGDTVVVAPLVSRHFDFLDTLTRSWDPWG